MVPTSHPDILVTADYAFGRLQTAAMLAVEAHLRQCPECSSVLRATETFGGLLLARGPEVPLTPGLLAAVMSRLGSQTTAGAKRDHSSGFPTQSATSQVSLARRWRFPNGVWAARLNTPKHETWRAFLVGAPAGASLPEHRHRATEFTCVLEGAVEDGGVTYRPGDFSDGSIEGVHRVRVNGEGPGMVLLATEKRLEWTGVMRPIGRLLGL